MSLKSLTVLTGFRLQSKECTEIQIQTQQMTIFNTAAVIKTLFLFLILMLQDSSNVYRSYDLGLLSSAQSNVKK